MNQRLVEIGEIVFQRDNQLWAIDVYGSGERRLTNFSNRHGSEQIGLRSVTVSPDGNYVALVANNEPLLLSLDDGSLHPLLVVEWHDYMGIRKVPSETTSRIVWNPDSQAVFVHTVDSKGFVEGDTRSRILKIAIGQEPTSETIMESVLSTGPTSALGDVLNDECIVILRTGAFRPLAQPKPQYFLFNSASHKLRRFPKGYVFSNAHPPSSRLLLTDDPLIGWVHIPTHLFVGQLSDSGSIEGIRRISPEDKAAYWLACYNNAGDSIAAMRTAKAQMRQNSGIVVFKTRTENDYEMITISSDDDYDDWLFSWTPDDQHIVIERRSLKEKTQQIWIMAVDGSERRFLTFGQLPIAVGGRFVSS